MSAIKDLPESKNYGLGFNYSVWTAGTTVTLANVRWNSDYRDIYVPKSRADLDEYIRKNSGPVIEIDKLSYAKFGRPIRLDTPFNTVQNFNYIRVSNPMQPITGDTGRVFYYFITDVVYVNPNCTEIFVQLDSWATFGHTVKFGNCFIEQGHAAIADEDSFADYGRKNLTVPEGLDIGNEYQIVRQYQHFMASARRGLAGEGTEPIYQILIASTVALDVEDYGTVDAPKLTTAEGSLMENLPNGCELYVIPSLSSFKSLMAYLSDKPWISQGIISIMAIPQITRYGGGTEQPTIIGDVTLVGAVKAGPLEPKQTVVARNWRDDIDLGRYGNLKKFLTFPYCVLEATSYSGTPLMLKPECWGTDNMELVEVPHLAPPNPRIAVYPYRYNTSDSSPAQIDENGHMINDGGEYLDVATGIFNMPTFSVVNNGYMSYMASNANSIAYQHSSADWSQQKTQQGISTSYDQATASIGLSNQLTNQGINAASAQANLANEGQLMRGVQGGINGVIGNAGNPAGMAGSALNAGLSTAIDMRQTNAAMNISNQLAASQNKSSTDNMAYMRDTNKSLSEFAANGDYQNAIAGINARVQDAKLIQPTTSGQMGGEAFNLAANKWGTDIKVKMPQAAVMRAIGEYWLRYGYAINRFGSVPENLHVMEKFTYWKLKETYIVESACPESIKQIIRGIFEKGVTVWADPEDIGSIDIADNAPLPGVRI